MDSWKHALASDASVLSIVAGLRTLSESQYAILIGLPSSNAYNCFAWLKLA